MILILFFVPYHSSRYFIHRPDTLLTFMSIHLTDWFFPILPECSRIIQDHPLGISTMLKRGKIGLKYDRKRLPRRSACSTQREKRPNATIYPLIFNELEWLFIRFLAQMHIFATSLANVCDRGCKRLRPGSQPLIGIRNCLLQTILRGPPRHLAKSIWSKTRGQNAPKIMFKSIRNETKSLFLHEFPAQNRPNVQWFSLDGKKMLQNAECHFVSKQSISVAFWYTPPLHPLAPWDSFQTIFFLLSHAYEIHLFANFALLRQNIVNVLKQQQNKHIESWLILHHIQA